MKTEWTEECDTTRREGRSSRTYFPNVSFVLLCNQQCLPHPTPKFPPPPTHHSLAQLTEPPSVGFSFSQPFPFHLLPTASRLKFSFIFYAHSLALARCLEQPSRSFGRHNLLTEMENIFDRRPRGGWGKKDAADTRTNTAKVKRAHTDRLPKRWHWAKRKENGTADDGGATKKKWVGKQKEKQSSRGADRKKDVARTLREDEGGGG